MLVQKSIHYMETHLDEEIGLAEVASHAGLSPYHFHRVFRREVGMTVTDYIRTRRLSYAAGALRHSDHPILEISMDCGFESQEAFTRAFKRMFGMPPGRYRKIFDSNLFQGGERTMIETSHIKGWILSGTHPHNYEMGLDQITVHQGKASAYLKSTTVMGNEEFATLMQSFKAGRYLGKRMKFSGFVKTSGVEEFSGLWMRVDNNAEDVLQFDNMNNRRITGDTSWNHYSIVLDIPDNSASISIGVLLMGKGQVWVDGFKFEEVDKSVPTTNVEIGYELADEPMNLSFEE
ncbi:helix-turn-helix domain-containing protein [Paenibacillus sp. CAA11]|uniref:helix-turn-helix domain-containing protein n=1 Tax=Paenibacillus sp. CAA11 TaxID=1532905 RepID=UPI001F21B78B|nr:AraC family transcriptional regulator [Paenibacillus sp. CAA11]